MTAIGRARHMKLWLEQRLDLKQGDPLLDLCGAQRCGILPHLRSSFPCLIRHSLQLCPQLLARQAANSR